MNYQLLAGPPGLAALQGPPRPPVNTGAHRNLPPGLASLYAEARAGRPGPLQRTQAKSRGIHLIDMASPTSGYWSNRLENDLNMYLDPMRLPKNTALPYQ